MWCGVCEAVTAMRQGRGGDPGAGMRGTQAPAIMKLAKFLVVWIGVLSINSMPVASRLVLVTGEAEMYCKKGGCGGVMTLMMHSSCAEMGGKQDPWPRFLARSL